MKPPPVPAHLDLRDFPFMPLDVLRLRDSDLATLSKAGEFKAAVLRWCAAWHQVPAGSIPDDDRWLARHSCAGREWPKVKEGALRGFKKYSDGRLHHPVIAEKALTAWGKKQDRRFGTLNARIAKIRKKLLEAETDAEKLHLQRQLHSLLQTMQQKTEGDGEHKA
jgi:hypothetical protein